MKINGYEIKPYADLHGANLSGADLRSADLTGANLTGADLRSADLRDANLSDANLSGADLRSAKLYGANLTRADLTRAILEKKPEPKSMTYPFWKYGESYKAGDIVRDPWDGLLYRQKDRTSGEATILPSALVKDGIRWEREPERMTATEVLARQTASIVESHGSRIGRLEMKVDARTPSPAAIVQDAYNRMRTPPHWEIIALQGEVAALRVRLQESEASCQRLVNNALDRPVLMKVMEYPDQRQEVKRLEKNCVSLHAEVKLLRQKNRVQFDKLQAAAKALRG